jgi:hypothetical protein
MRKFRFRCYTLTITGVKTGRAIHFALMNKASTRVIQAQDKAVAVLPIGLKGIRSDNGSEFRPVDLRYRRYGAAFSRGRPYSQMLEVFPKLQIWESHLEIHSFARLKIRKTARVCPKTVRVSAQSISFGTGSLCRTKNYAAVHKIAGCFRYQGAAGVAALQEAYDAYNPLLYYLCMKQTSRERTKTPFRRLLEQSFENALEVRRSKTAAPALKECTDLAEQKLKTDQAVDSLLTYTHDVPVLPCRGTERHGQNLTRCTVRLWFVFYVV